MTIDPEKIGVWVPAYLVELAPGSNAALLLAQVTWLIQPDRSGMRRTEIVEHGGHEWIVRTDEDWWWIGLDRSAAHRARLALVKESLLHVAQGSANGRRATLIRPNLDALTDARIRAIGEIQKRASARPNARIRTLQSADARNSAVLIENTTLNKEPNAQPALLSTPPEADPGSDDDPSFVAFWSSYPRKVDKGGARKAWRAAIKKAAPDTIVEGAQRFARDPNLPPPTYIAHPSTWLNGERWQDGPLPSRTGGTARSQSTSNSEAILRRIGEQREARG